MEDATRSAPFEVEIIGDRHVENVFVMSGDARWDLRLTLVRSSADRGRATGYTKAAAVFVPGSYSNRNFWLSRRGLGLAPFVADEVEIDTWIVETRAHGESRLREGVSRGFLRDGAEDQAEFDLPAVQRFLVGECGYQKLFWVGHSWGGMNIMTSAAGSWLKPASTAGAVVLGAQCTKGGPMLLRMWLFMRLIVFLVYLVCGCYPSRALGFGPENETSAFILDFERWRGLFGAWAARDGFDFWGGLAQLRVPLLAFGGADDTIDPPDGCRELYEAYGSGVANVDKEFVVLGKPEFEIDYQHVPMVVSKNAAREVWPRIAGWIKEHL